jgi:putative endonuclease
MSKRRLLIGELGERLAMEYLIAKGYSLLEHRFRCSYGEIDIVMIKDGVVVFVEVRCKTSRRYGTGAQSITERKKKRLINLQMVYLAKHQLVHLLSRIDIISICFFHLATSYELVHIENAVEKLS